MASSSAAAALISVFLLLTIQIHARDSQFFSKVTNQQTETTVETPNKEKEQQSLTRGTTEQQTEQKQPEFFTQDQGGYGLYGHESGLSSPSNEEIMTKSRVRVVTPGTYSSEKYYNNDKNEAQTQQFGSHGETYYLNSNNVVDNGEKYYSNNKNGVGANPDDFDFDDNFDNTEFDKSSNSNNNGETYYTTDSKNSNVYSNERYVQPHNQNNYNNNGETETKTYYDNNTKKNSNNLFGNTLAQTESTTTNDFNNQINSYRAKNRGNVQRQGMSDTRFMENGKYYYDLENEQNHGALYQNRYDTNNYNTNRNNYDSFSNQAYETNEVNNNNNNNFYDNSGGEKYEFNTMEEYERSRQNQYDP